MPEPAGSGDRRLACSIGRRLSKPRAVWRPTWRPAASQSSADSHAASIRPRIAARSTAGRTIAVLGSGVDRVYPPEHTELADRIAQTGLGVSEYPPGTLPLAFHFPMRNRLISGLSRAVVVIEASDKSGSLITASCAAEQGRDVMAVPGNVLSGRNRGGHALIRDGAKIVECADDIVAELGLAAACLAMQRREQVATDQRVPRIRCCGGWTRHVPTISTLWRPRVASMPRGCCRILPISNCADSCVASGAAVSCVSNVPC